MVQVVAVEFPLVEDRQKGEDLLLEERPDHVVEAVLAGQLGNELRNVEQGLVELLFAVVPLPCLGGGNPLVLGCVLWRPVVPALQCVAQIYPWEAYHVLLYLNEPMRTNSRSSIQSMWLWCSTPFGIQFQLR